MPIAMVHLISSAVLGAGGLYHAVLGPERLDENGFGYDWKDGGKMTTILGIHLVLLGLGALLLVLKATRFGGIYDPLVEQVRLVQPNLDPGRIFGYLFGISPHGWTITGMASVDNLEDVIGGHVWVSALCIGGGLFHIFTRPFGWAKERLVWSGEAYLSYSLGALAIAGFSVAVFVSVNEVAYPPRLLRPRRRHRRIHPHRPRQRPRHPRLPRPPRPPLARLPIPECFPRQHPGDVL